MKNKIRELTDRNKGISNEVREKKYQEYVRGWVEYFKLADTKKLLEKTDKWARRRIRAVYWKLGYTSMLDYYLVVCEN